MNKRINSVGFKKIDQCPKCGLKISLPRSISYGFGFIFGMLTIIISNILNVFLHPIIGVLFGTGCAIAFIYFYIVCLKKDYDDMEKRCNHA